MSSQASDQYGPAPAATYASPGAQAPAQQKAQSIPFVRAARRASQQDFAASAVVGTGQQQLGPFDIQTNGFLRYLELYGVCTTAANAATTAFNSGTSDSPFIALINNSLQDPSSEFIINPYTGYELFLMEKYGAIEQSPYSDPRADPNFFTTTGVGGGLGGSFGIVLRVPLEDRQRDALAAVPNSAANKNYRFTTFLNTTASIYSTAPTNPGTFVLNCTNFYWTEPPASIAGVPTVATPNGNGTVAYLDREVFTAITSQTNPTLIFKNVGRVYKMAIFILRLASGARDGTLTDWPNPAAIISLSIPGFPKCRNSMDLTPDMMQLILLILVFILGMTLWFSRVLLLTGVVPISIWLLLPQLKFSLSVLGVVLLLVLPFFSARLSLRPLPRSIRRRY